MSFFLKLCKRM